MEWQCVCSFVRSISFGWLVLFWSILRYITTDHSGLGMHCTYLACSGYNYYFKSHPSPLPSNGPGAVCYITHFWQTVAWDQVPISIFDFVSE